ncbi:MAG: metallophosphoesterase family protein [Bacteroidaceae bacterium]|nr:metallophosphoesterase family protein [Bacteroidaceae bacterium]
MKRKISIACTILVVGALAFWCCNRWDVWFHNPEEGAYQAPNVPTRVLLTFGDADGMHRNLSWMCGDEVRSASVELVDVEGGRTEHVDVAGEVFESRAGKAAYYVARLRDLKSGHYYRYRVWTGDEASEWYTFFVQDVSKGDVSFLYMGDIQDSIGGIANRLLRAAFRRNPDAEFFVCGGDLTERPTDAYWGETFESLDSVGQTVPVLTVTGNHDYLKGVLLKLERRFSLVHSYFLDSMVGENQVFTVCYKDLQLFCLDSNRELPYLWEQRKWLEEQLQGSRAKWKIVVLHHPLYSIKGSTNNLIQRWMFDGLIREYGVDVVLQGHEHAYARMTHHEADSTATTPVYTVSHCSPKNYRIEFNERFDKFGSGSRYYQKVRTSGDTLFLSATDANAGTCYDSLFIVKKKGETRLVDCGKEIPEVITFTPAPNSKKDAAFAERIEAYKQRRNIK